MFVGEEGEIFVWGNLVNSDKSFSDIRNLGEASGLLAGETRI